jgi:phage terminase large subunit
MLIPLSQRWLGGTDAIWNGTRTSGVPVRRGHPKFGHVEDEQAIFNYQGGAYQFIGFDELTQFTPTMYEYIAFSRARRDVELERAGVPTVQIRSTANPGGVGHQWVKNRFVDADTRKPGAVFIPAKVADNPGLDVADYTESLSHLGESCAAQLLDGDWGAFEGAAYPMFERHLHVVDAFDVPGPWERFESVDPGSTNPCAWLAGRSTTTATT